MSIIYSAANVVEAQLVLDELSAGGVQAFITGHYLSGAIGELPPTELIGIWLHCAEHLEQARAIIAEFESQQHQSGQDWRCLACNEWIGREFGACWQCGELCSQEAV